MWSVDETWKRDIKAALRRAGISQADLARQVGVTASAITVIFRPTTKQTRLKPAIHKALGLTPPTSTPAITRDEGWARMMRAWPHTSDEEKDIVLATIERFVAAKR